MRLLSQTTLYFQEGNSDKVYEVDLCEVGTDKFIVNFRYGRRGAVLREGTKTDSPVSEAKARTIFSQLVTAKEKKGYSAEEAVIAPTPKEAPAQATTSPTNAARDQALLALLNKGDRSSRPLDRVIWRVGELRLSAGEPMLLELLGNARQREFLLQHGRREGSRGNSNPVRVYSLLWALGRCGGKASVAAIEEFRAQNSDAKAHVLGIAYEALRMLAQTIDDETLRTSLKDEQVANLLPQFAEALRAGEATDVETLLSDALERHSKGLFKTLSQTIVALYRHGGEVVRPALLNCLEQLPLERGVFDALRAVFKAAEYRRDGEIFGILAHRFETVRAGRTSWDSRDRVFSKNTRLYLRKRVARTLERLGEDQSDDFIPMAVGVLLPPSSVSPTFIAVNLLLYGQGDKEGVWGAGGSGFMEALIHQSKAGSALIREEAFPELWNARPEALLHLIDSGSYIEVHKMAVAVLRDCPDFTSSLDLEVLEMLVSARFDVSAKLGFDLIKDRTMTGALARVLCTSRVADARSHAHAWLRLQSPVLEDSELWASLIMSDYEDNRSFVRSFLAGTYISEQFGKLIVGRVIADIKNCETLQDCSNFVDIAKLLLVACEAQASTLGEEVLRDLLGHSLWPVQEFGAELLLHHKSLSSSVPQDILIALLDSDFPSIRLVGTRLLGKLPQFELSRHPELFIHLALHELSDLRQGASETILRIAQGDSGFAKTVAAALAEALVRKLPRGVPADVVSLLQSPALAKHLPAAEQSYTMRLLRLKSPHARQLGLIFLDQLHAEDFTLFDLVSLADHEMIAVRHNAWEKCKASTDRFRITMPAVARLLDASWQDTRTFAIEFLETHFAKDDLGAAVLIAICDSIRPEIQQFGQKLITEHFREEDGQEYLAKLSEHPSTRLQNFVTNYLERYATDDAEKLSSLTPYFLSVLSRVNAGGVAKRRCLRFLEQEGLKGPAAAVLVAEILTRQSVTMAIGNKASIIAAMVALRDAFPDLSLPIIVNKPQARTRGGKEPSRAV